MSISKADPYVHLRFGNAYGPRTRHQKQKTLDGIVERSLHKRRFGTKLRIAIKALLAGTTKVSWRASVSLKSWPTNRLALDRSLRQKSTFWMF